MNKLETLVAPDDSLYIPKIKELETSIEALSKDFEIPIEHRIAINMNLGSFYDLLKDYKQARTKYTKALQEAIKENDSFKIGNGYMNLGILETKEKNFAKAENLLKKSSDYLTVDSPMIYNNLADVYLKENEYEKALINYQKAITQSLQIEALDYQTLPKFEDIELSPDKLDILGYLIDKANGWIAYYHANNNAKHLEHALETFTLADRLIDIIYVESREDLSKLFWRKRGASFYPKAVEVCHKLQQPEKAFFFMEKNKAMLLLENMTIATAKRLSKLPQNILEREQTFIKEIKTLESKILASSQHVDELKSSLFAYKKEYNAFIDSLEKSYPKYYNYKKNINIITLQEVQNKLEKDALVLHYIVGKEKGFVALIDATNIQLKELPTTTALTTTVESYKKAVSKPLLQQEDRTAYETVAKQLYQNLIPFEDTEQITQKKITIIADDLLQYIPFEALRSPEGNFLIETAQIQYNYSLSSLAQAKQNKTSIKKSFIAIAPTKFKNEQYGTLGTSVEELQKLSHIFNANHFQYEKATKERFTEAYGNYKIIHLSTHGGIDNTVPWMAFYDEKITLDELYFTKNQSELVVLSACKTSDGELKKGEGVMSLARGFFNAGAKSIISSLWDINEKASNDIIQEFYRNIVAGDTKSLALQKAKLTYIKTHKNTSEASPYYWSALTLTGDISPIDITETSYLYYILGALFLTGILIFLRLKRKRQKRNT